MGEAMKRIILLMLLAIFVLGGDAGEVHARGNSECNGPMGGISSFRDLFGTYCEAVYMARVARDFGMNVSAKEVYRNKLLKVEICQFVGHDIRIQNLCLSYVPH